MSQPLSKGKPETTIRPVDVLIVAAGALFLALPMVLYGPMVRGDDTYEHLNYCRRFAEQFWNGEWYPRWLLNLNHGLGSPTFFVYPPFGAYVYAFLQPVGARLHINPFNASEFLALFASGICAFLFARTFASRLPALVGAFLYMLMPYHLAEDYYRRTAISECWALAWMPLVLYFAVRTAAHKRASFVGLAVAYALLVLSHLVSVLIFSLIPLALVFILAVSGEKLRALIRVSLAMALGTGLACFYFVPALAQARNFPVLRSLCPPYYYLESNLIGLTDIIGSATRSRYVHWIAIAMVTTMFFSLICGVALWRCREPKLRRMVMFWIGACIIPVFLMSTLSLRLWSPQLMLFQGVQYPWRFNVILCLAGFSLAVLYLEYRKKMSSRFRIGADAVLLLTTLVWLASYGQIWQHYRTDVRAVNSRQLVSDDDGWFDSWTAPGTSQAAALNASALDPVRFSQGSGTVHLRVRKPREIEFDTDSSGGGSIEINQFYYPAWKASVRGTTSDLATSVALPEGLLKVQVPAGNQQLRVAIPVQPTERAGQWLSLVSCLLCLVILWKENTATVRNSSLVQTDKILRADTERVPV